MATPFSIIQPVLVQVSLLRKKQHFCWETSDLLLSLIINNVYYIQVWTESRVVLMHTESSSYWHLFWTTCNTTRIGTLVTHFFTAKAKCKWRSQSWRKYCSSSLTSPWVTPHKNIFDRFFSNGEINAFSHFFLLFLQAEKTSSGISSHKEIIRSHFSTVFPCPMYQGI